MLKDIYSEAESRMKGAIQALEEDLAGIRTGRASPAWLSDCRSTIMALATPLISAG